MIVSAKLDTSIVPKRKHVVKSVSFDSGIPDSSCAYPPQLPHFSKRSLCKYPPPMPALDYIPLKSDQLGSRPEGSSLFFAPIHPVEELKPAKVEVEFSLKDHFMRHQYIDRPRSRVEGLLDPRPIIPSQISEPAPMMYRP